VDIPQAGYPRLTTLDDIVACIQAKLDQAPAPSKWLDGSGHSALTGCPPARYPLVGAGLRVPTAGGYGLTPPLCEC